MNDERLNGGQGTTRLEGFSDAAIAIAITLMVIEIRVPEVGRGETLAGALLAQWPSYPSYAASFCVIGIIWANHHHSFRYIRHTSHALRLVNVLFLMSVAFIPFPTALLGEHLHGAEGARTAAVVYAGTMAVMASLYNAAWWLGTGDPRLVDPDADPRVLRSITRRYLAGLPLYLISFIVAFFSVWASLGIGAAAWLLYALSGRDDGPDQVA